MKLPIFLNKSFFLGIFNQLADEKLPNNATHIKVFTQCIKDGVNNWVEVVDLKKGVVNMDTGLSSDIVLEKQADLVTSGQLLRERPCNVFPGQSKLIQFDNFLFNQRYGIGMLGYFQRKPHHSFLEEFESVCLSELRMLYRKFPFEADKIFFLNSEDWIKYILSHNLKKFPERPNCLMEYGDTTLSEIELFLDNEGGQVFSGKQKKEILNFLYGQKNLY